ncbi:MAG: VWA domain-containing protein [Dehalococcoidia bacterium]|nr:VWA domain-containing protein [Dehalococcoidia bacterium]
MEFAAPYALLLAALVAPLAWLALRGRRGSLPLPSVEGLRGLPVGLRIRAARYLPVLLAGAVVLLAVGLARPQIGEANARVPAQGIDIVLALDLSSSMTTPFGQGKTRLQATREVAGQFVSERKDDRIGLVVFEFQALAFSAPTLDHKALGTIIATIDTGILPDGTAIGLGLAESVNLLRDSTAASRVVILLTDGEHNAPSISPEDAAKLATAFQIRVYTVGLVEQGGPGSGERGVDSRGLKNIAESTGGRFFPASDPGTLKAVYDEIGRLETSAVGRDRFERFTELGPWFLGGAAVLVVAYLVLAGTWLRVAPA